MKQRLSNVPRAEWWWQALRPVLPWGLLLALTFGIARTAGSDSEAFVKWASAHAVPIESLDSPLADSSSEALRAAIGSARVVGLGESRHDTREQLLMKSLLVRHLVEDLGFRVLILEESFPHAAFLDRYVTSGEGDPRALIDDLAGWYLWDTEEMLELVQWIRSFNESRDPDRQIRVFGMDITAPAPGVREVLEELSGMGVHTRLDTRSLGLDLQQGDFWPASWERCLALTEEQRDEFASNYDELIVLLETEKTRIIASSSEPAYERLRWLAEIGRWGIEFFSAADRKLGGKIREFGMSQTVLWILEHETPGKNAIVWAHNLHVAKSSFLMPAIAEGALEPMGVHLHEALASDYVAIGGTFGQGAYGPDVHPGERVFPAAASESMDGALAAVGLPMFVLDLRGAAADSEVDTWLRHDREWRAEDSHAVLGPIAAYDLVYFVRDVSRSQPTPLALRRFQSWGP